MVQRSKDLCFTAKPRKPLGVTGEMLWQDLYGDVAIEPLVARAVDLPHPTATE